MTTLLPPRLKHALLAPVAALTVLAFVLLFDLLTRERSSASMHDRRQRVEATRRELRPLFDELRNE